MALILGDFFGIGAAVLSNELKQVNVTHKEREE